MKYIKNRLILAYERFRSRMGIGRMTQEQRDAKFQLIMDLTTKSMASAREAREERLKTRSQSG